MRIPDNPTRMSDRKLQKNKILYLLNIYTSIDAEFDDEFIDMLILALEIFLIRTCYFYVSDQF
jgi:hypothetical protein